MNACPPLSFAPIVTSLKDISPSKIIYWSPEKEASLVAMHYETEKYNINVTIRAKSVLVYVLEGLGSDCVLSGRLSSVGETKIPFGMVNLVLKFTIHESEFKVNS